MLESRCTFLFVYFCNYLFQSNRHNQKHVISINIQYVRGDKECKCNAPKTINNNFIRSFRQNTDQLARSKQMIMH